MKILGIETSCDDTCAAVVEASGGIRQIKFRVRSNVISSQIKTHAPYGGVVPTLAARDHAKNLAPIIKKALQKSRSTMRNIDLIAVTTHPGLIPALLVGVHGARALAWRFAKPIIGVNHLAGHVASILLPSAHQNSEFPSEGQSCSRSARRAPASTRSNRGERLALGGRIQKTEIYFPAIGLIVSGGHTQLVLLRELSRMRVIGETRDDAAGEAFDKIARMLGLPFPGGPAIAKLASQWKSQFQNPKSQEKSIFVLPRPMIHSNDFDFSFSGLKTAVFYLLGDLSKSAVIPQLCAETQQAIIDVLVFKTIRAAKKYRVENVFLSGGVAANRELRKQLREALHRELPSTTYTLPHIPYTLDNAAMIAAAGYLHWLRMTPAQRQRASWQHIRPKV